MRIFIISFIICIGCFRLCAQVDYSLNDVIAYAQSKSLRSKLAAANHEISTYRYQAFLSENKPQISFYGSLPAYSKDYFDVRQDNGTIKFLPRSQNFSNLGFSLFQTIAATGGTLSVNTDVSRFDDFNQKIHSYNGTPVYIRLNQPLFGFNQIRWNKKIEPLLLQESYKSRELEYLKLAIDLCSYYFEALSYQQQQEIALFNLDQINLLNDIEQKRINLGTASQDLILQLHLQGLRSKQIADKAKYDYQVALLKIKTEMGLAGYEAIRLTAPSTYPLLKINIDTAIHYAKKNRPEFISFRRRNLEAERAVLQARADKKEINLTASFGYNNAGDELSVLFNDLRNQQRLTVGFDIPLVDWGRREARLQNTKALQKLNTYTIELEEQKYIQEINALAQNMTLLLSNIEIAKETESIALQRFSLAQKQFQLGKQSLTELIIAQQEKDQSQMEFLNALRSYWLAHYQLRLFTFYDFEQGKEIMN